MAFRKPIPIGDRYSRVVVIGVGTPTTRIDRTQEVYRLRFRCDCGKEFDARFGDIAQPAKRGKVVSCGCYRKELNRTRGTTHGLSNSRTWSSWKAMIQRCTNQNIPHWGNYGGRGITFAPEWEDFEQFLADMGIRPPGLTLDRIDNSRGYGPGNCRWASHATQHRNRRNNRWVVLDGKSMIFGDAVALLGVKIGTAAAQRVKRGWTHQETIDWYSARRVG